MSEEKTIFIYKIEVINLTTEEKKILKKYNIKPIYIGQTKNPLRRWSEHKSGIKKMWNLKELPLYIPASGAFYYKMILTLKLLNRNLEYIEIDSKKEIKDISFEIMLKESFRSELETLKKEDFFIEQYETLRYGLNGPHAKLWQISLSKHLTDEQIKKLLETMTLSKEQYEGYKGKHNPFNYYNFGELRKWNVFLSDLNIINNEKIKNEIEKELKKIRGK